MCNEEGDLSCCEMDVGGETRIRVVMIEHIRIALRSGDALYRSRSTEGVNWSAPWWR